MDLKVRYLLHNLYIFLTNLNTVAGLFVCEYFNFWPAILFCGHETLKSKSMKVKINFVYIWHHYFGVLEKVDMDHAEHN